VQNGNGQPLTETDTGNAVGWILGLIGRNRTDFNEILSIYHRGGSVLKVAAAT
jgi:hypothetical protein